MLLIVTDGCVVVDGVEGRLEDMVANEKVEMGNLKVALSQNGNQSIKLNRGQTQARKSSIYSSIAA